MNILQYWISQWTVFEDVTPILTGAVERGHQKTFVQSFHNGVTYYAKEDLLRTLTLNISYIGKTRTEKDLAARWASLKPKLVL